MWTNLFPPFPRKQRTEAWGQEFHDWGKEKKETEFNASLIGNIAERAGASALSLWLQDWAEPLAGLLTTLVAQLHCLFWRCFVPLSGSYLLRAVGDKISRCIACWLRRMFFCLSFPQHNLLSFCPLYGFIIKIHCRGLFVFFFLAFLGDIMSIWSSGTQRSFSPMTFLCGWKGSATLGTARDRTGWVFQGHVPVAIPDEGKDKREEFDSVASFFRCSQGPVQSHTHRQWHIVQPAA